MSLPTSRDAMIDELLTDFAIAYGQDLKKSFVADRAASVVRAKKQSAKYPVWNKGDMFRIEMDLRADGTESKRAGFRVDLTNSYFAEVYALSSALSDRTKNNSPLDLEKAKVRYLMQQAKMKRDKLWAAVNFITGVWTGNTEQTGVAAAPGANQFLQFNDANSDPIGVITGQMLAMEVNSGVLPNVAVCNTKTMNALKNHPDVVERVKYTGKTPALVEDSYIAQLFGLEEVIVARGVENTAAEGATASMARIFGNHFVLLYRAPTVSEEQPTSNALFAWSEFDQVTADGAAIDSWYDKPTKSTIYEAEQAVACKRTADDLGVMLLDAVA